MVRANAGALMRRILYGIVVPFILLASFLTFTADFRAYAPYSQGNPYPRLGEQKVTISFSTPHGTKIGRYDWLKMENCSYITTPGYPMLPVRTLAIKLPEESIVAKVDVEVKETPIQGSYQVVPAPFPQFSDSQYTSPVPDMEIYGSNKLFPENWYQQREAHGIDAETETRTKYVFLNIFPLRLLPTQNAVIRADEITVTIQYSIPPETQEASSTSLENLVVTSPNLEPYAISLATWKNSTGVPSRVLNTTWIYNRYTGIDDPEKIRNCIRDFMLTYGITYVTIFGDTDQVPIRYAFINDTRVGETYVPTDLYYADLDGTWDSNGDGLFADRRYDIIDGLPDVCVGRIPVSLTSYAEAVVNKIIGYQSQAYGDWMNRIILSAGTTSGDGFSDVELPGNTILNDYIGDVVSYLNATKLYEQYGNLSTANMGSEINKGALFLNFAGHGDPGTAFLSAGWLFYWVIPGLIWNGFGISDVRSRTNGFKLPVVTAMSCSTARLDDTDCLGEWFVGHPQGGGIAYWRHKNRLLLE